MTVSELIEHLQQMPRDYEVSVTDNSGGPWPVSKIKAIPSGVTSFGAVQILVRHPMVNPETGMIDSLVSVDHDEALARARVR